MCSPRGVGGVLTVGSALVVVWGLACSICGGPAGSLLVCAEATKAPIITSTKQVVMRRAFFIIIAPNTLARVRTPPILFVIAVYKRNARDT